MCGQGIHFTPFDRIGNVENVCISEAKIQMKFLFTFMWSARPIAVIPKGMHYHRKINALLRMHTQRAHWMSHSLVNRIIRARSKMKKKEVKTRNLSFVIS